jgi:hypothetical protein
MKRWFSNLYAGCVPVAHACKSSYSGGRDQEDCGWKSAWANSSQDPISKKKTHHKKGLVEWIKMEAPSSSPSTAKTNKQKSEKKKNL